MLWAKDDNNDDNAIVNDYITSDARTDGGVTNYYFTLPCHDVIAAGQQRYTPKYISTITAITEVVFTPSLSACSAVLVVVLFWLLLLAAAAALSFFFFHLLCIYAWTH